MILTKDQDREFKKVVKWYKDDKDKQVYTLLGRAGTGKTTLIKIILDELGINSSDYITCAPTGKASVVLSTKGLEAVTIHKLIYMYYEENGVPKFKKKEFLDHDYMLIIVDEFSMVSENLFKDLLSFGIKILAFGDSNQLPPVGGDNPYMKNPDGYLNEITRQDADSPIIVLSDLILKGYVPVKSQSLGKECFIVKKEKITDNILTKVDQSLVYRNVTRQELNKRYRNIYNKEGKIPVSGDKIIVTRNMWNVFIDDVPLINGTIGEVLKIKLIGDTIARVTIRPDYTDSIGTFKADLSQILEINKVVPFSIGMIDFGYAITCHKSQGSEYNKVYIDFSSMRRDMVKPWLYTAVTRAKQKLIISYNG